MSTTASDRLAAGVQRGIVGAFRQHWATSAPAARRLRELGLKDSPVFQDLVTGRVIRRAGPDRYFLHEDSWAERSRMSWTMVARIGILLGVIAVVLFLVLGR